MLPVVIGQGVSHYMILTPSLTPANPPPRPHCRWGWGCGPTMISRRGSSVGSLSTSQPLNHPLLWWSVLAPAAAESHCDCNSFFLTLELTVIYFFYLQFWASNVSKDWTCERGQLWHKCHSCMQLVCFQLMTDHNVAIGVWINKCKSFKFLIWRVDTSDNYSYNLVKLRNKFEIA